MKGEKGGSTEAFRKDRMRGENPGSKLVIVCKRLQSEVDGCTGARPMYLERYRLGRDETSVGCFEAEWTVKVKC